ncbi:hypothetical protein [Conservatibacter flavescens]|uniref:Glycosyltransferase RgtA/B/C/D-like domain-containing protein n=1 Tax=Conservatibacter flavescens TaxID=28161 RepID=A0A2M8RZT2_9PAST|nr:hypothetical protein [Conservatibacter flavescens]PJG84403.1 hypothetical protein CVP05_11655 [Conservatibacter flavescens]
MQESIYKKLSLLKDPYYIFIILLIFIRLYLGEITGFWFPSDQAYDDALMIQYALPSHYQNIDHTSLLKTMSFPIFLDFVYISQLNYSLVLSIFWCISALTVLNLILKLNQNKFIALLAFIYFLFLPTAFEIWMGTRLYRNSIIAPFTIMSFSFILWNVFSAMLNRNQKLFSVVIYSLVFSFTFYIKEDGVWLLACLVSSIILCLLIYIYKYIKGYFSKKIFFSKLILLIMPLLVYQVITVTYKSVNQHFFGVYAIETRNGGELGRFTKNIYKIKSDNRTSIHWAPADSIDKAFNVSPTFQKHLELRNKIIHTPWFGGDAYVNPIKGDFLTWVLRTALVEANVWTSEKDVDTLFKQINSEVEKAFEEGILEKETKFQLVSSTGGKSIDEIKNLWKIMRKGYQGSILLHNYSAGSQPAGNILNMEIADLASRLTHTEYLTNYEIMQDSFVNSELANKWINFIFSIYKKMNVFCILLCIAVISYCFLSFIFNFNFIKDNIKRNKMVFLYCATTLAFILLSFVYTFAIAWFSEFIFTDGINMTVLNFYNVANSVLLGFAYIFAMLTAKELFSLNKTYRSLYEI